MDFSQLQHTSKISDEWRYPLPIARDSGLLQVDRNPDHRLYWEEFGNPIGEPVMVLHGGPGGASAPFMARYFDPERYRVILFDQRGCGRSQPNVASADPAVSFANNTTAHLIADIDRLRTALGIDRPMHVFGGSWGSTLAMAYAIDHPQHCASLILRGIFLGTVEAFRFVYQGNAETFEHNPFGFAAPGAYISNPEAWSRYVSLIPPADRSDMMKAYKAIFDLTAGTEAEERLQRSAALAWSAWEATISHAIPDPEGIGDFGEETFALCFARIEAHFFANSLFMDRDHIVRNVAALARVPIHIVHGRFDLVCPLTEASRLVAALKAVGAEPMTFVVTNAGHSGIERENVLALTAIMDGLPRPDG